MYYVKVFKLMKISMSTADVVNCLKHEYVLGGVLSVLGMNTGIEGPKDLTSQVLDDSNSWEVSLGRDHCPLGTGDMPQCGIRP